MKPYFLLRPSLVRRRWHGLAFSFLICACLLTQTGCSSIWFCLFSVEENEAGIIHACPKAVPINNVIDFSEHGCEVSNARGDDFPKGRRVEVNGHFVWSAAGTYPRGWQGDDAVTARRGAAGRVAPCSYDRMLRFLGTTPNGPSDDVRSDVYQLIDLEQYDRPDTSFVGARVLFNRADYGNAGFDIASRFDVQVEAFEGDWRQHGRNQRLGANTSSIVVDNNEVSWEELTLSMPLPAGTRYLAVTLAAVENVAPSAEAPEFRGNFADGVRVALLDGRPPDPYDVRLEADALPDTIEAGRAFFFALMITNDGPNSARDLQMEVQLPGGYDYRAHERERGSYDPATRLWRLGDLAPGETTYLRVLGSLSATGVLGATLVRGLDADLNAANNIISGRIVVRGSVSTPPTAFNDGFETEANTPILLDVLANDVAPNSVLVPASVAVTAPPQNGTAMPQPDGTLLFTPASGFVGEARFAYTVRNQEGLLSNEASVVVDVVAPTCRIVNNGNEGSQFACPDGAPLLPPAACRWRIRNHRPGRRRCDP